MLSVSFPSILPYIDNTHFPHFTKIKKTQGTDVAWHVAPPVSCGKHIHFIPLRSRGKVLIFLTHPAQCYAWHMVSTCYIECQCRDAGIQLPIVFSYNWLFSPSNQCHSWWVSLKWTEGTYTPWQKEASCRHPRDIRKKRRIYCSSYGVGQSSIWPGHLRSRALHSSTLCLTDHYSDGNEWEGMRMG